MVAYSFQPRFAPLIVEGLKTQTIRADRLRHARVGERLQLFTGMRTAQCRKIIPDPVCYLVEPIDMTFSKGRITRVVVGGLPVRKLDYFAGFDGFQDIEDMSLFWTLQHGISSGIWSGVLIEWTPPRGDRGAA